MKSARTNRARLSPTGLLRPHPPVTVRDDPALYELGANRCHSCLIATPPAALPLRGTWNLQLVTQPLCLAHCTHFPAGRDPAVSPTSVLLRPPQPGVPSQPATPRAAVRSSFHQWHPLKTPCWGGWGAGCALGVPHGARPDGVCPRPPPAVPLPRGPGSLPRWRLVPNFCLGLFLGKTLRRPETVRCFCLWLALRSRQAGVLPEASSCHSVTRPPEPCSLTQDKSQVHSDCSALLFPWSGAHSALPRLRASARHSLGRHAHGVPTSPDIFTGDSDTPPSHAPPCLALSRALPGLRRPRDGARRATGSVFLNVMQILSPCS